MSNLDFSGLKDISTGKVKKGWSPLTPSDLGYGTVLCFDQSLTATGCLILQFTYPESAPVVYSASQWRDKHDGKDVRTSLRRGTEVFLQARDVMRMLPRPVDAVVHESPPNPAAVKGGGYSSLLAAQSLHCACAALGMEEPEMIGAQPAKRLVCGNANAKKTEAHAALKAHVLPWILNSQQVTNEATRDALMVGLLWLHRRADPA